MLLKGFPVINHNSTSDNMRQAKALHAPFDTMRRFFGLCYRMEFGALMTGIKSFCAGYRARTFNALFFSGMFGYLKNPQPGDILTKPDLNDVPHLHLGSRLYCPPFMDTFSLLQASFASVLLFIILLTFKTYQFASLLLLSPFKWKPHRFVPSFCSHPTGHPFPQGSCPQAFFPAVRSGFPHTQTS